MRINKVTKNNIHECLMHLAFEQEKNQIENDMIKNISKV